MDDKQSATCTHVSRQITRKDLIQLLPDAWVTDYEKLHESANVPIESTDSHIHRQSDGTVTINFNHSHLKGSSSSTLFPSISMLQLPFEAPPSSLVYDLQHNLSDIYIDHMQDLIQDFDSTGQPSHWFEDPFSHHCYFDDCKHCPECQLCVCGYALHSCLCDELDQSETARHRRRRLALKNLLSPCSEPKLDIVPNYLPGTLTVRTRSTYNAFHFAKSFFLVKAST